MQVQTAASDARELDVDVVAPTITVLADVQGLVEVSDQVLEEQQRFETVAARLREVGHYLPQALDLERDAVAARAAAS